MSNINSVEQDKKEKENRKDNREYGMEKNQDKRLDGPNRPTE